ncbi:MAG: alpha/beta fold hydrolase [Micromonosporaceae bacterium]
MGRLPPVRRRRRAPLAACALVAVALAATGVAGLAQAGPGTVAREVTVDGVPVLVVSPEAPGSGRPAAVVAHGFAASATLMRGVADTLASRGYVVALPDVAGHGRNTAPLPTRDLADRLQADLAAAVDHVRTLPSVDPSRIVLVGHSMGAGAVVAYAATHPDIRATVAISLGSTESLPHDAAAPQPAARRRCGRASAVPSRRTGRAAPRRPDGVVRGHDR